MPPNRPSEPRAGNALFAIYLSLLPVLSEAVPQTQAPLASGFLLDFADGRPIGEGRRREKGGLMPPALSVPALRGFGSGCIPPP